MEGLFQAIDQFIGRTHITEQIGAVDVKGLFTNMYFLIPFCIMIVWALYKQALTNIVMAALVIGLWIFSGSSFMQNLFVDGNIQIGKILPIVGVGVFAIAVAVYFIFIRSD